MGGGGVYNKKEVIFNKKILHIIESLFFVILYSILGTLFFTVFHTETYWLTINGNNGFIGSLFEETFFKYNASIEDIR